MPPSEVSSETLGRERSAKTVATFDNDPACWG